MSHNVVRVSKNYPQCTSSTPPVIFETLPSCDFQVFVSRYENETSTRPNLLLQFFYKSFTSVWLKN
ncbi:MAG: hypothetical protein R3B45_11665 [Bdellovibrionota bacterium]